jgi:hypothetical protein
VLVAIGIDHLARDHFEVALLPGGAGCARSRRQAQPQPGQPGWLATSRSASPSRCCVVARRSRRPAASCFGRTRVLCPTHRQQLGQQPRNLAERCQRRIPGGDIGKLWRDRIIAQIQGGKTFHPTLALTRAGQQPSDANRHIAEQGAERHGVVPLARQPVPTGNA